MTKEKKEAIDELDKLISKHLDDGWDEFCKTLDELREDIDTLSIKDIRRIKKHLKNKGKK